MNDEEKRYRLVVADSSEDLEQRVNKFLVAFIIAVTISSTSKVNECIKAGGNPIMKGEQLKECKR